MQVCSHNRDVIAAGVIEVDDLLVRLGRARASLILPLTQTAALLVGKNAWSEFGYRNQEDYARERLRRSGRWLRNLAALHGCFRHFPVLGMATAGLDGKPALGRSAALALGRVATRDDIEARIRRERETPGSGARSTSDSSRDASTETQAPVSHAMSDMRTPVRVEMPPEIRVALDEVLELHRAVSGQQVGYASLMEAFVADAVASGWRPPTVHHDSVGGTLQQAPEARRERRGADRRAGRATYASCARNDVVRPAAGGPTSAPQLVETRAQLPAARRAQQLLGRCAEITQQVARTADVLGERNETHPSNPNLGTAAGGARRQQLRALERVVRKLVAIEDEIEMRIAELLVFLAEERAWQRLGSRSLADYARERLHLSRASAHRRVRLARGLRSLQRARDAYEAGTIGANAALWIVQQRRGHVGEPSEDVVRAWIEHARTSTLKRLGDDERVVRRDDLLRRAHIAAARAGVAEKSFAGAHRVPTDAEWHAALFREPGLTGARVAALGHAVLERVVARAALVPVHWSVAVDAALAHQFLAFAHSAAWSLRLRAECSEAGNAAEDARAGPALRIARTFVGRGQSVPAWVGMLALLEEYTRTWDDPAGMSRSASDAICHRDGARCMAPGCTARRNLQVHHATYRSRGGGNQASNLVLLCAFHHQRGEHGGLARCRGAAPLGLTWRLGAPELASWFRNEQRIDPSGM